jgi:hypothetical protein
MWVELCSKRNKKEAISKAVVDHNIQELHAIINKDLQIINDYFDHLLEHYHMTEDRRQALKAKIKTDILAHVLALQGLQQKPQDLSLANINSWRIEFDQRREKHYSAALHAIDALIQKENPAVFDEEESEHYIDILKRMATLEEKMHAFSHIDLKDAVQKKLALNQLLQLEDEAHHLNADLRLSQETSERLQPLMQQITALRKKLESV